MIWALIKFFEEEDHADQFVAGRLYMNTLGYFKELEAQSMLISGRADPNEAVWAWLQPQGIEMTITLTGFDVIKITGKDLAGPISMGYKSHESLNIFCMYAIHSRAIEECCARQLSEMGECRIDLNLDSVILGKFAVIVPAGPFIDKLKAALNDQGHRANGKLVTYYDDETFSGEISFDESPFWKQKRFRNQQEFRICVRSGIPDGKPLVIDIGDLSRFCTKLRSSDLPTQLLLKRVHCEK